MSHQALAPGHAREYETIYILRPNIEKELAEKVAGRVTDAIKGHEGILTEAELWGRRRLAYPIAKHFRGTYVYVKYFGRGDTVAELERQLRLADSVIRYQTIQLRTNVPIKTAEVAEDGLELDFDLPFEPDEPEVSRVKELGLDAPPPERRRRDERYGSRDRDRPKPTEGGETTEAKAKATEAAPGGDAAAASKAAPDGDAAAASKTAPDGDAAAKQQADKSADKETKS